MKNQPSVRANPTIISMVSVNKNSSFIRYLNGLKMIKKGLKNIIQHIRKEN